MSLFVKRLIQISANLYIPESEMKQERLEQRSSFGEHKLVESAVKKETAEFSARKINVSSGEDAFFY